MKAAVVRRPRPSVLACVVAAALCSATAHAQEGPPAPLTSPPSSTDVISAPPPTNLRLSVACADHPFVTPADGLAVSFDGGPALPPGRTDYALSTALTRHGNEVVVTVPTDVAYTVPPDQHRLAIAVPRCATTTRDVVVPSGTPLVLEASLPTDPGLRGPVDAPDGIAMALGGFYSTFPKSLESGHVCPLIAS
jgi:hypothetical protein